MPMPIVATWPPHPTPDTQTAGIPHRPLGPPIDTPSSSSTSVPTFTTSVPTGAGYPLAVTTSSTHVGPHSMPRIAYLHNNDVGNFHYGDGHPMKPARLALTHNLVVGYGLHRKMSVFSPRRATDEELTEFHTDDYIEFIKRVTPENVHNFTKFLSRFNIGVEDCPVFDGLYDFCCLSSGSSIEGARMLNAHACDIAINWSGGLHHAKKFEASGFCYTNDIVLAILDMLRYHPRIVYIDIDVHHGDGVQEAFYHSNRVMTVSFHRYDGQFFPGTGALEETGSRTGKHYSVNVPLLENMDDTSYAFIFRNVMTSVMSSFRPSAIVLQCGADSLASDRLGCFNLSIKGHGECVKFMKSFGVPMLVVGGGGYTIRNVARCWTYETSVLTGTVLDDRLPLNDYLSHYAPDFSLHPPIVNASLENMNTSQYLENLRIKVNENLRFLNGAPSVQMQAIPPPMPSLMTSDALQSTDDIDDGRLDHRVDRPSHRVEHVSEHYDGPHDHDRETHDDDEDMIDPVTTSVSAYGSSTDTSNPIHASTTTGHHHDDDDDDVEVS